MTESDHHPLNSNWKLWFHKTEEKDWTINGFIKLAEFNNILDYCIIMNSFEPVHVQNAMLFIMRDNIQPLWEADDNINGGSISFKIYRKEIYNCWNQLANFLVGEKILKKEEDILKVNGISISPKKTFSIMKIWFKDNENNESKYLNNMNLFKYEDCIYKSHK